MPAPLPVDFPSFDAMVSHSLDAHHMNPSRSSAVARRADFTQARLKELLRYDPGTGVFTRLTSARNGKAPIGKAFGTLNKGYMTGLLVGMFMRLNRLAWLYMTGEWPKGDVDHENTVKADNRWSNLRDVPHIANSQNRRRANVTNKLGTHGVNRERSGRFRARIRVDGRLKGLGAYDTEAEAGQAFIVAKRALHVGCTL